MTYSLVLLHAWFTKYFKVIREKKSLSLISNLISWIFLMHLSCIWLSPKLFVKSILGKQKQNEKLKIKQTMMHSWGCESPKPLLDTIVFFCEMKSSIYFFFAMVHSAQKSLSQVMNLFFKIQALFFHFGALCLGTNCKLSIIEYRQNNTQFILSNHCHHFFNLDFLFHNEVLGNILN